MPLHSLKRKRTSSDVSTSIAHVYPSQGDPPDPILRPLKPKPKSHRTTRHSPVMLSDPLSSPSSDEQSFDEDDMYGSDPDVETISLRPLLQSPESESQTGEMDEPLVLVTLLIETYFAAHM